MWSNIREYQYNSKNNSMSEKGNNNDIDDK